MVSIRQNESCRFWILGLDAMMSGSFSMAFWFGLFFGPIPAAGLGVIWVTVVGILWDTCMAF